MHQSMFSPPVSTLIKVINKNFLKRLPFLESKLVRKYLEKSPATAKGIMKCPRKGIISTRVIPENMVTYSILTIEDPALNLILIEYPAPHLIPDEEVPTVEETAGTFNNVSCFAALADKEKVKIYIDATGALSSIYINGHQYLFITYYYDNY